MRLILSICLCLIVTQPALADGPHYHDDRRIKASIEQQGRALHDAGKTVTNDKLLEQLDERKSYNAPPPAPATLTKDGEQLYDKVEDGVLVVSGLYLCGRCDKLHGGNASGFVISGDGLAVTNYHVVESKRNVTMVARLRDGSVVPIVEVLAANRADDVALIRLGSEDAQGEAVDFSPVPITRSAKVGEPVHAVTHPSGRFYHYASGEVARFYMQRRARNQPPVRRIGVTAEYAKGSSGGPIFNDAGQVVAMVCSTNTVYYNNEDGDPRNPQMVFRDCVPYASILDLFEPDAEAPEQAQGE